MSLNIFRLRTLKSRLTLFTLLIVLMSLWSLSFYASQMLRRDMERLLGEQQFSTATIVAAQVNQELETRLKALEMLAGMTTPAMLERPAAMLVFIQERPVLQALFNGGIVVHGPDGTAIVDFPVSPGRIGTNFMDIEAVAAALNEGISSISKPLIGKTLKSPAFGMVVPVRNNQGTVIGALSGIINLGQRSFLDQITSISYGQTGGFLLIDNRHRLIVTATDKSRIMATFPARGSNPVIDRFIDGYEGSTVYVSAIGVEVLVSAKRMAVVDWGLAVSMPTAEAFAPIHEMQQRMLFATLLLTLLATGLTWWIVRRQLSLVLGTIETLTAISEISQPVQHLPITSKDEIGQLIASFNRLLGTLGQRETALRESEERWKFALEGSGAGVWDWNIQTGEALYSKRWKEMLGFAESEIENNSSEWSNRVHPEDMPGVMTIIQAHIDGQTPTAEIEFRILCKDGRWKWTLGRGMVVSRSSDGKPLRLVGTNTDISERKFAEEALREQKEFFHLIAENIGDFIAVLDRNGQRLYNSPSYSKFFGSTNDLIGTDSFAEIHPEDQERVKRVFRETVQTGVGRQIHYRLLMADGSIREMESLGNVIKDGEGQVSRVVVVSHDITKQMEDQVRQMAFYDELTELPNRRLLHDRLRHTMAASARSACYGALMFLDLDNFKTLNDSQGHVVGDLLLIQAAERLKSCVREMDTVARFGGDEFVVMISELDADKTASATQAGIVAEKIRAALSEPYRLTIKRQGETETSIVEHHCTTSIGVTLFINHQGSLDDLLKWADAAMYQAKEAGRNVVRFHDFVGDNQADQPGLSSSPSY